MPPHLIDILPLVAGFKIVLVDNDHVHHLLYVEAEASRTTPPNPQLLHSIRIQICVFNVNYA